MNRLFRPKKLAFLVSLSLPFCVNVAPVLAANPYPALPPTLSTSVTPNVMLYIDTSGSMLQDTNNAWMLTNLCNSNSNWSACVNNNTNNYRTRIDSESYSPNTKMNIAKRVAKNLVANNLSLRFGLFSFQDQAASIGGDERGEAGVLRAAIKDMSVSANKTALDTAISNLNGRTATPLGEGLLELTRYFEGKTSLYQKTSGSYTSPIQYRCQKNFAIVLTDGDATNEDNLPGSGKTALSYTARDSDGAAVSKSFSVCTSANTAASDSVSVNCPASLEGSTGNPGFGDTSNRFRALRDVAKYAQVADLRVGGTDLDGKSFDDPKFARQNLSIYTIGFAVQNDVLPAAASVGGGKYFVAGSESELSTALSSAVNDIIAQNSNGGGITPRSDVKYVGNTVLQPLFNSKGWYGELRCKTLNTDGSIGGDCTIPKATIPAAGSRKIYTSKVTATNSTAFSFDDSSVSTMTTAQSSALGANTTEIKNVINWIRGTDVSGMRTRANGLLGDMIETQPTIMAAPSGSTPDAAYSSFKAANAHRGIALVGANDGMMHAFSLSTLNELMGYVPAAVYGNLKLLTKTDYGSTTGGTSHTYYVSGAARSEDIKIDGTWKSLFVSGLGQGGQGYFALDATTEATLTSGASNAVKWEMTDTRDNEMGYTFGAPIIYNVRNSATNAIPAVILSNGYENNYDDTSIGGVVASAKSSALYVVNASTGALISKITVPGSTGLSSPAGWDSDGDGVVDYVYAGDLNGKVWRFDLTQAGGFKVSASPIFNGGTTQPVVQRPGVYPTGTDGEAMIIFGTGKLLVDADRTDTNVQALYGIVDRYQTASSSSSSSAASSAPASLITTAEAQTAAKTDLVKQSIVATYTETSSARRAGTYRKMSENTVDLTSKRGWYVELPGSGERLLTSPMVYEDKVVLGTGLVQSGEVCLSGGKGWIMGLNPLTGSVPTGKVNGRQFSFVDLDGDKRATAADQISFSGGAAYAVGYDLPAMPTELSVISDSNATITLNTSGAYGALGGNIALRDSNLMAVFRQVLNKGTGTITVGEQGSDTIHTESLLGPSTGVRVETGPWKELK